MRASVETDNRFMREALALSESSLGRTSPNPSVGCVIVRAGKIVARGVTGDGGRPHGETVALSQAGKLARGATAYVAMEPCAHHGQTPPCAEALVEAGVARVVIGCGDPDPRVKGKGIAILKRSGIAVSIGILEDEARALNEGFITRITRGRPMGLLKLAMSLDGRIAAEGGDSRWISSVPSRDLVHLWRSQCDAVMVGAGTVIADNPRLTSRIDGCRDPVRVVIDARLRTAPDARIYRQRSAAQTILVTIEANLASARRKYAYRGVEVIAAKNNDAEIDLAALMREFAEQRGWCKVLIEGGATLAGKALRAGIVDRVAMFIAPRIIGAGLPAIDGLGSRRVREGIALSGVSTRPIGDDVLFEARIGASRQAR